MSRVTLASDAGMYRYLAGELSVRRARKQSGISSNGGWDHGFVMLGQICPQSTMKTIAKDFDNLMSADGAWIRRGKGNRVFLDHGVEVSRMLTNTAERMPSVLSLVSDALRASVNEYFGCPAEFTEVSAWRNWHVPDELTSLDLLSDHWHQDSHRSDIVKVFVALSDITDDDGPFHFIDRKASRRAIQSGYRYSVADATALEVEPGEVKRLIGPAGTAAIVNTIHCLHRAGLPAKGRQRDIIELRFKAVH